MFEIGNSLREARVRQGLDYPQVELATKIRAKYIRALEEEHFEVLPSGTYIKGFMRSYAEFLGLDGQLYVDEYNSRHVVEGFDDMPQRRPRVHQNRSIERKVVLLALAGIAAVTALVIVAWKFGGSGPPASTPPVAKPHKPAQVGLRFVGVGKGTYLRDPTRIAHGSGDVPGHAAAGRHELSRREALLAFGHAPRGCPDEARRQARVATRRPQREGDRHADENDARHGLSRPRAVIVVTGSELVRGERTDLNGPFLAREALRLGLEPARIAIVGDVAEELEAVLRAAFDEGDVVLDVGRPRADP